MSYPPAAVFESVYAKDPEPAIRACRANFEALALDLAEVGITVTCAPVLDVPVDGAHDVIGDRAFSRDSECVSALGRACLEGLWPPELMVLSNTFLVMGVQRRILIWRCLGECVAHRTE